MVTWGILGWGNIAKRFESSLSLSKGGILCAVASQTESKRNEFRETHPDNPCKVYDSYEQLLLDKNIDAIYIALPHKFHMYWTIEALNHKKAVLCEKPIGISAEQLKRMTECAVKNQCFLLEALKTPFIPFTDVIREDLKQGIVGEVKSIYANFCSDSSKRLSKAHYMFDIEQGGALYDVGTYPVAFVLNMIQSQVIDIKASMKMINGIDYSFEGNLLFKNGVIGKVEGAIDEKKTREAVIAGDKGTMIVPMYNRAESYQVTYLDGTKITKQLPIAGDDLLGEIEETHRCMKLGLLESPKYSWEDSMAVLLVNDWIRRVS